MRREGRRLEKRDNFKTLMYVLGGILGILMIIFGITFGMYSNKVKQNSNTSKLNMDKVAELVPSVTDLGGETRSASIEMGRTVNEIQNIMEEESNINETNDTTVETNNKTNQNDQTESAENVEEAKQEEPKKELSFTKPVEGEITIGFAKDNLVYSETLQEWVTHRGVDIKANKTTVVKAAESGTVKSIKNDPRYGLTITIEHEDGYKTVYSSLLSAEFVVEGEKVEKGASVGTIGNTAVFESAEEPHLHFEILKDDENVDPTIYLK